MSRLIDITVEIRARTPKAILVNDGSKKEVWLPLSQIEVLEDVRKPGIAEVTMTENLAREKGLI
jgi:hypothetical protein